MIWQAGLAELRSLWFKRSVTETCKISGSATIMGISKPRKNQIPNTCNVMNVNICQGVASTRVFPNTNSACPALLTKMNLLKREKTLS